MSNHDLSREAEVYATVPCLGAIASNPAFRGTLAEAMAHVLAQPIEAQPWLAVRLLCKERRVRAYYHTVEAGRTK